MKKVFTILLLLCFKLTFSQVYQKMPQYGYDAMRMKFDSTLQIPTTCGVPTLKSNVINHGAIAFDSCNNRFYSFNPKTQTWSQINGGTGGSQDLQSVLDNGFVANGKSIDLYSSPGSNNEVYISPNEGSLPFFGMRDSMNSYLLLQTTNSKGTPNISFTTNGHQQFLQYIPDASGFLWLPYQNAHEDTLATLNDVRFARGRNYKSFVASITSDHTGSVTSYNILENTIYDFSAVSFTILYYPSGGVYDISTNQPVLTDESKMWFAKPSFQNDVVAQEHEGYMWYSNPYHIYFKVLKANGTAELGFDKMMIEIRQYD